MGGGDGESSPAASQSAADGRRLRRILEESGGWGKSPIGTVTASARQYSWSGVGFIIQFYYKIQPVVYVCFCCVRLAYVSTSVFDL
jgi:hypothetical protein